MLKITQPAIMIASPSSAQKGTYWRCTVQLHSRNVFYLCSSS